MSFSADRFRRAGAGRGGVRWAARPEAARAPLIIGHRGVRGEGAPPENTLPAFEEAARQGADAIELDVRVCATGELLVLHDPDLGRVTGGADTRRAADLRWEALRRVDVGGARVPLLSEVLAFARVRRLAVNVEMKRDAPSRAAVVRATARLLSRWDPAHAVMVSSFDPAMLGGLRLLAPRVPRALLVHRSGYHDASLWAAPALGGLGVHIERTIASPARVARLLREGRVVNVWTVNDAREARDLAALGVTGIITDAPGRIRAALEGRA